MMSKSSFQTACEGIKDDVTEKYKWAWTVALRHETDSNDERKELEDDAEL